MDTLTHLSSYFYINGFPLALFLYARISHSSSIPTTISYLSSTPTMANATTKSLLLLLIPLLFLSNKANSTVPRTANPTDFIKSSCYTTRYPALCIQSLSTYASTIHQSPRQLAEAALSVSLIRARSAAGFVSKMTRMNGMRPREYQAVKDCVDNMGDTVDRLSRSVQELGRMRGARGQSFLWHMSNVQTWVSAALTDENTCVDGFAGHALDGRVKAAIRSKVVNVAQVTSNALALVNRFAARH